MGSSLVIENWLSLGDKDDFVHRFAALPDSARRPPYRVGLLPAKLLEKLVDMPWPAPKDFFLVSRGRKAIATLGASISARDATQGFIGFYECDVADPDAAKATGMAIEAAEAFLRGNGAQRILAPVDYNTWFPYRFSREDSTPPFYSWEAVQPPEFVAYFRTAGYRESTEYVSIGHDDPQPFIDAHTPALEKGFELGYSLRQFDTARFLDDDVPVLHRITMAGFADSYLFEPLPLAAFRELYVPIANKLDLSYGFFLLDPAGKEVGFLFSFFDSHHKDHFVIKTMTLLPEARGKGLSNALVCNALRLGRDHGSKRSIHAMMRSDAQSRSYGRHVNIDWEHHYLLMEKAL